MNINLSCFFSKVKTYFVSALIIVCISSVTAANASSIRQVHMDDMLKTAKLIFQGQVIKSEARWTDDGSTIKTYIVFDVEDVISGEYQKSQLTLSFEGGTVDQDSVTIAGMNAPQLGEKGIYFIENLEDSFINPIMGWSQGHFLLEKNVTGEEIVLTQNGMNVVDMSQQSQFSANERAIELSTSGVADGITASTANTSTAMTSKHFKQIIKLRLQNLK